MFNGQGWRAVSDAVRSISGYLAPGIEEMTSFGQHLSDGLYRFLNLCATNEKQKAGSEKNLKTALERRIFEGSIYEILQVRIRDYLELISDFSCLA